MCDGFVAAKSLEELDLTPWEIVKRALEEYEREKKE